MGRDMSTYSVVAHDGQVYGPVDEASVGEWIRQGRVNRDTVLHCHQTNARISAGSVPGLQPMLGLSEAQVSQLLHPPVVPGYAPHQAGPAPMAYATPGGYGVGGPPHHGLSTFSTAGAVLLSIFVPFFALIFYGLVHGNLPKRRHDDPSAARAIGFMFIPIFSIYWTCFFWVRLCTRINDERARAGLPPTAPRGLVIAILWCFLGLIIPFVNLLVLPAVMVMLLVALIQLQGSINDLVRATWRGR